MINKCNLIKWLAVIAVLLTVVDVFGQTLDLSKLETMKPREIGPAGMSGRVTAIDVVTKHPEVMLAGTASGGLWKSVNAGVDWKPVFEKEKVSSIGAVAIQQSNPDVIWVGTGEGNPRNSVTGGGGVYKSLDGGNTWIPLGLEGTRNVHRIIIHPNEPNTVYVGAIGSSWGEHAERGLFKTTDGGKSWNKILYENPRTGVADMVMDPSNPNKIIVAMWEHQRKPWTFNSGGPGSGVHITVDGGETWKKITEKEGFPKGELGRVGLAIAPSEPNRVYALVESKKNALYRSDDGGVSWSKINDGNDIGDRPFYYSEIIVDPKNENRLYTLFSMINVSEDGGKSFNSLVNYSQIHPDHHAFWIHPENSDFMIDGNDGGMNITHDRGKTWRFVDNIPVAQFYHINADMDYPYNVYGGMQDNGSWAGPAYVLRNQGIRNSYWQEVMFGDGFDVVPDPDDSRFGYAMSQQGNVGRYDLETGRVNFIQPTHPDADTQLRFNWNAAIAQDPFDNSTIYYGSQFVHKSLDKGKTWEIISKDLTTNDPEKQKQHLSGGLTLDATGAENYTTIIAIEPSPVKKDVIWVGTDDGKLQLTQDGGKTWTELSGNTNMPKGAWIPQIRASKYNAGEAYVVVNNYRLFDFKPYLFRTRDFGKTWENLVNENSISGFLHAVVQDPIEKNLLFLGSENGLYVSVDEGKNWTKWTNGYPTVPTLDLVIHPREHDLVIGTFGRAAWILDDIRPLREIAGQGGHLLNKVVHVYSPPVAIISESQQPEGARFPGNEMFQGENRPSGAQISYSINRTPPPPPVVASTKKGKKGKEPEPAAVVENKDKPKADSVFVDILNAQAEVIRTIKFKAPEKDGLYKIYWRMDEKGAPRPSRRAGGGNRRFEPGGVTVLPGTYQVKVSFGGETAQTQIEVKADPRVQYAPNELKAKYDALKELEELSTNLTKATKSLSESLKIVNEYSGKLKDKKGDEFKAAKDLNKGTKEKIDLLLDEVFGKESDVQGIFRSPDPTVTTYLFRASRYIDSCEGVPGSTEQRLMKQAEEKVNAVIEKINEFFANDWSAYKTEMLKLDLNPFEEYEPVPVKK